MELRIDGRARLSTDSVLGPAARDFHGVILGTAVVGPPLVTEVAAYFDSDPLHFYTWFDVNRTRALVAGPYLLLSGAFLFIIGILVGNSTHRYGSETNDKEMYRSLTGPYGAVSQTMLICQVGGGFALLVGVVWTLYGVGFF